MSKFKPVEPDSDEEARQHYERRMYTYSAESLYAASRLDKILVMHPQFKAALKVFDRVYQLAGAVKGPMGVRLIAPTGAGKSTLIRFFADSLPSSSTVSGNHSVLSVRLRRGYAVGAIVEDMLKKLGYPLHSSGNRTNGVRRGLLMECLNSRETRLVFLDEADVLIAQTRSSYGALGLTELIRQINDETGAQVILSGTVALETLDQTDLFLAERINTTVRLDYFGLDRTWSSFVRAYLKQAEGLPLEHLLQPSVQMKLHQACGGRARRWQQLMVEVALISVHDKRPVDDLLLRDAYTAVRGVACAEPNPWAEVAA